MQFRRKNGNTKIGNISYLPDDIKDKYRKDMRLDTLLDHYDADSLSDLLRKHRK